VYAGSSDGNLETASIPIGAECGVPFRASLSAPPTWLGRRCEKSLKEMVERPSEVIAGKGVWHQAAAQWCNATEYVFGAALETPCLATASVPGTRKGV